MPKILPFAAALLIIACGAPSDAPTPDMPTDEIEAGILTSEVRPEAVSLLGEDLFRPEQDSETATRQESDLAAAVEAYALDPRTVEPLIWLGRRTAYMWRYQDAVDIYSSGLRNHPDEPRLLRHRGHRYISLRRFDDAVADLSRAAELVDGQPDEVEQDGQPNAAGIPTSTLQTNIWYHLALAHYLRGEFGTAADGFQRCFDLAGNDDMRIAAADWLYMSLQRDGRSDEAEQAIAFVTPDMELLENFSYLRRLEMYRGWRSPDELLGDGEALDMATQGYGVANHYWVNGDTARATQILEQVRETGYWSAFGYIAAEADLARLAE